MPELRNQAVQLTRFGDVEGLEVVEAAMPTAGPGEVPVRVLASGIEYAICTRRPHSSVHRL